VVAVVVAEHAYELASEWFEMRYDEGSHIIAGVQHKVNVFIEKAFDSLVNHGQIVMRIRHYSN
jgi:hypothetical protein